MSNKEITAAPANCEKHGPYVAETTNYTCFSSVSGCPVCGEERAAELRAEESAELERARAKQLIAKRNAAGIPLRGYGCSFDTFIADTEDQREALRAARSFAENFDSVRDTGSNLIFSGTPGTGKTHLAYAIANHLLLQRSAIYTTGVGLIRSIRETWRRDSDLSEAAAVNRYACPDLLIMDEVGAQFGSEGERVQVFDILDSRYQRMLPTLIVTNLNLPELRECLGERSYDRLTQIGGAVVAFKGKSYRRNEKLLQKRVIAPLDTSPLSLSERVVLQRAGEKQCRPN